MNGATLLRAVSATAEACELPLVLAEAMLEGSAAQLGHDGGPGVPGRSRMGPGPPGAVFARPSPAAGPALCRADRCTATAHGTKLGGLCWGCFARTRRAGDGAQSEVISAAEVPPLPDRPVGCTVPGCQRMSAAGGPRQRTGLCLAHSRRFRRKPGMSMELFLADPTVRPLPALGPARWRPAPDGQRANTVTAPPTTCGGAPPSPLALRSTSGTGA